MIWAIPFLVILGLLAGPILAPLKKDAARRSLGWFIFLALLCSAHFAALGEDPILRMVAICSVLLGAMKGLVYAEWARTQRLAPLHYFIFGLLWFGMDPGTFTKRRTGLSWKLDIRWGVLLMVIGTIGTWIVWKMEWRHILVMFTPISLGFHFGALRVLKGVLRRAGFPVRTLFPNLLKARGVADFWSRRWNIGYSQMMQRLVGRPVEKVAGNTAGIMAVFLTSGVLHEFAITLPVQAGWGLPTLYFTVHGVLAVLEKRTRWSIGKIPALLLVGLPIGLLFPPKFQSQVIERCLYVMELIGYISLSPILT